MTIADDETVEKIDLPRWDFAYDTMELAEDGSYVYWTDVAALIARLEASQAEVKGLRKALGPFAKLGDIILSEAPADAKTIVIFTSAAGEKFSMQLDYFRTAVHALSPPSPDRDEVGG